MKIAKKAEALFLAAAFTLAASGCAHKSVKKTEAAPAPQAKAEPTAEKPAPADTDAEPVLRNSVWQTVSGLKVVHFEYDSAQLGDAARATLAANTQWLKDNPEVKVQITGHCDQRGTVEYNLSLGQKRAKAVREYYRSLGIPGNRVATISFGKEKPVCQNENEACWKENRRAETLAAFQKDLSERPRRRY